MFYKNGQLSLQKASSESRSQEKVFSSRFLYKKNLMEERIYYQQQIATGYERMNVYLTILSPQVSCIHSASPDLWTSELKDLFILRSQSEMVKPFFTYLYLQYIQLFKVALVSFVVTRMTDWWARLTDEHWIES